MAFEELKVRLALLMEQASENPVDVHEVYEELREKLAEMEGMGLPLPADLVEMKAKLEADLSKE